MNRNFNNGMIAERPTLSTMDIIGVLVAICVVLIVMAWVDNKFHALTDAERGYYSTIMEEFATNPDYDNFMVIYTNYDLLHYNYGPLVTFWMYGVYLEQPQFYNNDQKKALLEDFTPLVTSILKDIKQEKIKMNYIDCLWSLYFATGDLKYAKIVSSIALMQVRQSIKDKALRSFNLVFNQV